MAYPTSVIAFGTKSPGQTIASAHVNDLQTEVTALETGLLNGLQHSLTISTGGLTVSTGNVTLGQDVTVGRNLTVNGRVHSTGQPRCLVYSTAATGFAANTWSGIGFISEEYSVGGFHSTTPSTNQAPLNIPTGSSGLYLVGAAIQMSTGGPGDGVFGRIMINSTTERGAGVRVVRSSISAVTLTMHQLLQLDGGDQVTVEVFPDTSTASLVAGTNRRAASEFWCVKLY